MSSMGLSVTEPPRSSFSLCQPTPIQEGKDTLMLSDSLLSLHPPGDTDSQRKKETKKEKRRKSAFSSYASSFSYLVRVRAGLPSDEGKRSFLCLSVFLVSRGLDGFNFLLCVSSCCCASSSNSGGVVWRERERENSVYFVGCTLVLCYLIVFSRSVSFLLFWRDGVKKER